MEFVAMMVHCTAIVTGMAASIVTYIVHLFWMTLGFSTIDLRSRF